MSCREFDVSVRADQLSSQRITRQRASRFGALVAVLPALVACSGSEPTVPGWGQGGGAVSSGGSSSSGGLGASGASSQGGSQTVGSGGSAVSTGGFSTAAGGSPSASGASSAGGSNSVGGSTVGAGTTGVGGSRGGSAGAASAGKSGSGGSKAMGGATASGGSGSAGKSSSGGSGAPNTGTGGMASGDRATAEGVCARWKADRANLGEGTWSGSVASCTVGDISAEGRANALRQYNLYRWLADLPAVTTDPTRDSQAQACALMQEANGTLSHSPPMSWKCWTQEGADGSASSNISGGPGVMSADLYMVDSGNETTFGHRRWILSNSLGPIGLGSTGTGSSCMQNLRGTGRAGKAWMAWPPPGIFPLQAIAPSRGRSVDATGWTLQSESINLSGAMVSVTANGAAAAVTVSQLAQNYGARYAIRILPSGWTSKAGQKYAVSVTGIATPISYEVEMVDCP